MSVFARIIALLVLLPTVCLAQPPDFSLMGFATMNGGTTGGAGGEIVVPTTFDELSAYCTSSEPLVILIDREFTGSNPDASNPGAPVRRVLRMASNKTLLGVDSSAFINQINININSKSNIIIRNIRFTMTDVPVSAAGSEVKIFGTNQDPDIISISADLSSVPSSERMTRNIWIDHCEFYNEDPRVMTNEDRYDGLIDVKNDVQFITISWSYFHDHHKGCLSGSGGSDNHDRKTTMHHNLFDNISSRIPLQRYGKLHLLNNYVVNSGNGLNVRIQSEAVAEKNYFQNTKKPIFGKPSEGGTAREIENYFDGCSRLSSVHIPSASSPGADALNTSEEYNTNNYVIPYDYDAYVTDVADVPALVSRWAGIGKITSEVVNVVTPQIADINKIQFSPTLVTHDLKVTLDASVGFQSVVTLVDISGRVVARQNKSILPGINEFSLDMSHLPGGIYLCQVHTGRRAVVGKVYKRE